MIEATSPNQRTDGQFANESEAWADLDQRLEEARQWMKDSFPSGTAELWLFLNQEHSDPRVELMSQFAILAFEETYLHVHTDGENPS